VFKNHHPPHESQVKKPAHISTDSSPKSHSPKNSKEDYVRLIIQHAWLEESFTLFSPKKLDEDLGNVMHARKRVSRNCALLQQQQQEKQLQNLP
jgi:hypothetical protein